MNAQTREWAARLQTQSAKADDSELRAAGAAIATKVKAMDSDNTSMQDMYNVAKDAETTLAKLCG
jgi:hypothetical protein